MPRAIGGMKQCAKCGEVKPVSEFSKNNYAFDKLQYQCKKCNKQYREENLEHIKEYIKQWYEENKEHILEYQKQYYEENREDKLEYQKQWHENNPKYNKQWREENSEYMKQWQKEKYANDPMFRLNNSMSTGIYQSLKSNKQGYHWENLVGYTLEQLKSHLESQFEDWMNWDNHGSEWHIDHIVPISLFNFKSSNDIEFKMCWCLVNLKPLDSLKNISKGNKFNGNLLEAKLTLRKHLTNVT